MTGLKRLATNSPVLFGLLVSLSVLIFYIASGVLAAASGHDRGGAEFTDAIGRLIASAFFLCVLWRFEWLDATGVTQTGTLKAWLVTLFIIAYEIIAYQIPLFGELAFKVSDLGLSLSVALNAFVTGLLEEIPFRGIVLYTFVRLWGDSRRGIFKSVIYSSIIFGAIHIIHIAFGRPALPAILIVLSTTLSGVYFAALVLRWRAIWTVVLFHGLVNAYMSMRAIEVPGFSETAAALGRIVLLQLPVVIWAVWLISRVHPQAIVPDTD